MATRALTPKYCLTKMAAALSAMEAAQDRFAEISGAYAGTQAMPTLDDIAAGDDPRLRSAISDTGYYAGQAQTYAVCASALLDALDRYSPDRGGHVANGPDWWGGGRRPGPLREEDLRPDSAVSRMWAGIERRERRPS